MHGYLFTKFYKSVDIDALIPSPASHPHIVIHLFIYIFKII